MKKVSINKKQYNIKKDVTSLFFGKNKEGEIIPNNFCSELFKKNFSIPYRSDKKNKIDFYKQINFFEGKNYILVGQVNVERWISVKVLEMSITND